MIKLHHREWCILCPDLARVTRDENQRMHRETSLSFFHNK